MSLTINYDFSDSLSLTSITSWDDGQFKLPEDSDGSPLNVLFIPYDFDAHQVAQDLRLISDLDGGFNFILGGYLSREVVEGGTTISFYSDIDVNFDGSIDYQDCIDSAATIGTESQIFPVGCTVSNSFKQTRDSAALYFDGSYDLADAVKLRFGARYTHDSGDLDGFRSLLLGTDGVELANLIPGSADVPGPGTRRSYSDDEVTGRLGLDYMTNAGNLLYVSLSQGYRSSAFNGQAFFDSSELTVVKPETLAAAEAGFKLDLLDQRLRLNGAAFWYGYEDQQFLNVDATTAVQQLVNVPKSSIYGGELESEYRVTDRLRFNGSIALLHSKIDEGTLSGVDLVGNALPLAPEFRLALGMNWDIASFSYGNLELQVDGSYVDSQYFDVFNQDVTQQDGYALGERAPRIEAGRAGSRGCTVGQELHRRDIPHIDDRSARQFRLRFRTDGSAANVRRRSDLAFLSMATIRGRSLAGLIINRGDFMTKRSCSTFTTGALVLVVLIGGSLAKPALAQSADKKPNIVFVLMDNLGYGEVGVYGGGILRGAPTPRIDKLAAEGTRLLNFNVEAQCTPSRSAILTGRHAIRSGTHSVPFPGQLDGLTQWEVTIAELLSGQGYATAHFGKWHLGSDQSRLPTSQGFDEWFGIPRTTDEALYPSAVGFKESGVEPEHIMEGRKGEKSRNLEVYDLEAAPPH